MSIQGYDKFEFGRMLHTVVSPSRPISTIEYLIGRSQELNRIEKALMVPGRNIFIFGDRGVGKSSLAATAASQYQSSDAPYIDVSCAPDSTVKSIVSSIAIQAIEQRHLEDCTYKSSATVDLKFLKFTADRIVSRVDIESRIHSLSDAVEVLKEVAFIHSKYPIVVIDEVDRMSCEKEIDLIGDLLKQMGDKKIDLKFIFTGVGKTLEEILGAHKSAIRQLETIELPRLSWDARWNIAIEALKKFNISISDDIYIRLAAVSDGYPYYVHLITEKLLWVLFEKDTEAKDVTWEDYYLALDEAVISITAELARPYDTAVHQSTNDYEEVVWSTSIVEWQGAYLRQMYAEYENIISQLVGKTKLSYERYCSRIRNLKKESHGELLTEGRKPGHYLYREKMMRGYVRMQAEANRIEIMGVEAKANIKNLIHVPSKKVGYHVSKVPKGWRK